MSVNNSESPNVRYEAANYGGIDISFNGTISAVLSVDALMSNISSDGAKLGHVDFSKVNEVSSDGVESKTKCLAGTFGIGADSVLADMYNNLRKTLDDMALKIGEKLGIDMENYSESILASNKAAQEALEKYKENLDSFGALEDAEGSGVYLQALASIMNKTGSYTNEKGNQILLITSGNGQTYQIEFENNSILSIGILGADITSISSLSDLTIEQQNALSLIKDDTEFLKYEDGSREYHIMDSDGNSYVIQKDKDGNVTGFGNFYTTKTFNYSDGRVSNVNYLNENGDVSMKTVHNSKGGTIVYTLDEETGVMNYNNDFQEQYGKSIINSLAEQYYLMKTGQSNDLLEDYEIDYLERMNEDIERTIKACGRDGLTSYQKTFLYYKDEIDRSKQMADYRIEISETKNAEKAAKVAYEEALANYEEACEKNVQAMGEVESIYKDMKDAEATLELAKEKYDSAVKESSAAEERLRTSKIDSIMFNTSRESIVDGKFDGELFDSKLNNNQEYQDLRYKSSEYWADYYGELAEQNNAEATKFAREASKKSRFKGVYVILDGTEETQAEYDRQMAEWNKYKEEVISPLEQEASEWKYNADQFTSRQEQFKAEMAQALLLMPETRESIIKSYSDELDFTQIGAGEGVTGTLRVFYDKDGKEVTNCDEIAAYCVQNDIDLSTVKLAHSREYLTNLNALNRIKDEEFRSKGLDGTVQNFTTQDAVSCYFTASAKYGDNAATDIFKYFNNEGARLIGYTEAKDRIEAIRGNYNQRYDDGKKTLAALGRFGSVVADSLKHGLEGWAENMGEFFDGDGRVSALQFETQEYMNHLANDEDFKKAYYSNIYEIGSSIGNMLPSIALSAITSGMLSGGLALSAAEATAVEKGLLTVSRPLLSEMGRDALTFCTTFASMGLSAAGSTKEQAMQAGMSEGKATIYGLMSGLSETGMEMLLGSLPGIGKMEKVFDELGGVNGFFGKMLSEAIEESTQEVVDAAFNTIFTGEKFYVDPDAVLKSGIYGAITSGIMSGSGSMGRIALTAGRITTNIVIDGVVQNTTTTPAGLSYILNKYSNLTLGEKLVSQELKSDLLHLNGIRTDLSARVDELMNDADFKEIYRLYTEETTDPLSMKQFASDTAVADKIKDSQISNTIGEEIATLISEREVRMDAQRALSERIAKLQEELGIDFDSETDLLYDENGKIKNNQVTKKVANLFEMIREYSENSQKMDQAGVKIFDHYSIERDNLSKLKSDLESNPDNNSLENREKLRNLERKVKTYEEYIGDVIAQRLEINDNYDVAKTNYDFYSREREEKIKIVEENEARLVELQNKLDEANRVRKESNRIDSVLASDIEETRKEINDLQSLNDKINARIKTLNGLINSTVKTMRNYIGEDIEKIGKAQELLASELNSKRDELEIVQKRIKELEKQETDLTIERARSDSAIEYEEEIKSVKEELNNLREQSRKLTLDVTYIQETIDNNNDRLSEIDNRIVPIKSVSENSDVASTGSEILAEAVGEVIDTVKDAIKDQLADDGEDDNQEQANEAVVEKVSGDEVVVEQEELRDVNENRPDGIIKATNNENEEQPDGSIFESIFGRKNNENNTINSYDDVELDEDALEDFVGGIKDVDRVVKVTMESIDEAEAQKHQIKRSTAKNKESFLKLVPGEKTGFDFDVMELNKEQIIAEGNRVLNSVFPNGKTGWEMLYESGVSRSITTIEQLVAENGKFLDPNQNNLFVIGPNGYREAASKLGAASFISPSWGTEVYNYIFGDNSLLLYYVTGNYDAIETALKQHKTICCTADLFGKYTALEISTLENVLYNLGFECEFVPKKVTAIDNKGNAYETILYELKTKKLTISPQETVVEDTMVESNTETTASSRFLDMTKEEIVEHFTSLTDETQIAKDLEEYIGLGEYSRNVLKSIIYNKETNAMVINALCKVNDDVIEVLEDENLIHIDSFQSLSNDALVFLAEKNLISQFDYAEFAEELASRDIDMDYDKFFKEMDRRNLSILLIEMESSDLLKKLFNKASYAQLINIMNSIGKNAKQELLNSIDPNFLNYYFKNNTDYDLMLQFVDKLDAENINKLLSESDNGIYEKLSVDVLAKIYNYGNSSFIDHISNSKLYELYKTTQSSNLLEILNSDVKRQKNIKFELTRKDGSNISIELKNIIKSSDNTVFVYEINGKQVFSETNIIDMIINESENVDGLINDYLADYRLEVSKGYIGEYKEGILSYEKSNELVVNNIINSYLRSSEEFFEHMRDNNSARQFGTDQETNNTDGGNKYLDRSSGVSDDINYSSYKKMVRFFESRFNMSESTVRQTISYIINNYEGACSYANLANIILDYYKDHSIEFKKKFGFDMYTLENGKKVLNTRMLMVYIYVSCNSSDLLSTGKIFSMNEQTGERIINTVTEENGKVRKADDREQVYMSYKRGYSNEAIKFLNSIGIDCRTDVITDSFDLETTKQRIREALLNGEIVSLGEHSSSVEIDKNGKKTTITDPTQKELVFHNMDGETDTSTKEWNEGGGHITYVVGMTEDSLIVISWGNKYEIKFSDLSKDNYSIKFLSLSSAELENARTDVEIYEQISNMSADEVLGIMDSIDFDYVVKNYLSKETIKELCEKIDPWDMISKVSSARSINLIFEAYGPEMASDLVVALSDSQILTCFKSNMIPSKAILDEFERSIFSMTSDIDVLTNYINYVKDHMSSFAFASERNKFYKKNPLKYIEYICNNYSEQELKKEWPKIRENFVNYLNTNKTRKARNEFISKLETIMSPNKFNNILKVYSLISFNDFSNYMQTSRSIEEYNQFIRENYTFDKLLETYEKQNSRELLDILFENCDGTPFVEKISSEKLLLYISPKTTEELERISEKLCLTDQMVFEQAIETFNNLNNERLENSIKDVIDGLDNWIEMVAALKDNGLLTEENIIKILNSQIVKSNDSLMIAVLLESLSKPSCIEALNKFIENGTEDEVFDVIAAVNQGFTNKARNTLASKLTDKAITRIREVNSDGILEYLSEERKAEYLANIEGIDSKLNDIIDRADGNWLNMSMLLSSEGLLTEENIIKIINSEVTRKNSDLMRVVLLSSMDKQNCINEINNFIKNGSIEDVKVLATALENGLTNKARNNLIPKLSNDSIRKIIEVSGESILEFLPKERIAEIKNNIEPQTEVIETVIFNENESMKNDGSVIVDTTEIVNTINELKDNSLKLKELAQIEDKRTLLEVINNLNDKSITDIMKATTDLAYSDLKMMIVEAKKLSPVGLEKLGINPSDLVSYAKDYYTNNPQYGTYSDYLTRLSSDQIYTAFIYGSNDYELTDAFINSSVVTEEKFDALTNEELYGKNLSSYLLSKTNYELEQIFKKFSPEQVKTLKSSLEDHFKNVKNFKNSILNGSLEDGIKFMSDEKNLNYLLTLRMDDFANLINDEEFRRKIEKIIYAKEFVNEHMSYISQYESKLTEKLVFEKDQAYIKSNRINKFDGLQRIENLISITKKLTKMYINGEITSNQVMQNLMGDYFTKEFIEKLISEDNKAIRYLRFVANRQNSFVLNGLLNERNTRLIKGVNTETKLTSTFDEIHSDMLEIIENGGNLFNGFNKKKLLSYIEDNITDKTLATELKNAIPNKKKILSVLQEYSLKELSEAIIDLNTNDLLTNVIFDVKELLNYQLTAGITLDAESLKIYRDIVRIQELSFDELLDLNNRMRQIDMLEKMSEDFTDARTRMNKEIADSVLNKERIQKFKDDTLSSKYGVDVFKFDGQDFYAITKSSAHDVALESKRRSYSLNGKGAIEFFHQNLGERNIVYEGLIPEQILHVYPKDSVTQFYDPEDNSDAAFFMGSQYSKYVRTLMTPQQLLDNTYDYNELLLVEQGQTPTELDSNMPFLKELALYCVDEITEEDIKLAKEKGIGIMLIDSKANQVNKNTTDLKEKYNGNYIYQTISEITEDTDFEEDFKKLSKFDRMSELNQVINNLEMETIKNVSNHNLDTIKGSILSRITPEMSELEKARLIYIELGKKVDYSSLYRYAIRNHESDELYNSEYNKQLKVEDLINDPNVICATWAQVYSEMLIEAGFDPKSIILQRLKVDEVGSENVYNSHVALYVMLDDGSIILPDMTIPIKQADLYNVKAGNNTTGFLLFTKEQQELLSKDYELWSDSIERTGVRDTLYYPQIESLKGEKPVLSKVVENTIKECGNYLYGFVLKDNRKLDNKKLAHEKTFFRSINKTNEEIIAKADDNIKDRLTKSNFFINEITEESKAKRNQTAKEFFDDFSKMEEITLENLKDVANFLDAALSMFGMDNVADRNIGTLQGYLRDVASQIGTDTPGSNHLALTVKLNNNTESNSLTINLNRYNDNNKFEKTIASFDINVDENGNYLITSKKFAEKINKLFEEKDNESICKVVATLSDLEIQTLESIGVDLSEYKYKKIGLDDYVRNIMASDSLELVVCKKAGNVIARQGTIGQKVTTWSLNKNNELVKIEKTIEVDPYTEESDWIVTKVDENGNPIIDENGHEITWIMKDSKFYKAFDIENTETGIYKPKEDEILFAKVKDNLILEDWCGEERIVAGGYINITNSYDMYAMSEKEITNIYKIETNQEEIDSSIDKYIRTQISKGYISDIKGLLSNSQMKTKTKKIILLDFSKIEFLNLINKDKDGSVMKLLFDEEGCNILNTANKGILFDRLNYMINDDHPNNYALFENDYFCKFILDNVHNVHNVFYPLSNINLEKGKHYLDYIVNNIDSISDPFLGLKNEAQMYILQNTKMSNEKILACLDSMEPMVIQWTVNNVILDLTNMSYRSLTNFVNNKITIPDNLINKEFVDRMVNEIIKNNTSEDARLLLNQLNIEEFNKAYKKILSNSIKMINKETMMLSYLEEICNMISSFGVGKKVDEVIDKYRDYKIWNLINSNLDNTDSIINRIKEYNDEIVISLMLDYYFEDVPYNVISNINQLLHYQISHGKTISNEKIKIYKNILKYYSLSSSEKAELFNYFENNDISFEYADDLSNARQIMNKEICDSLLNKEKLQKYKSAELTKENGVDTFVFDGDDFYALTKSSKHKKAEEMRGRSYSINGRGALEYFDMITAKYNIVYEGLIPDQIAHIYPDDSYTLYNKDSSAESSENIRVLMTPEELLAQTAALHTYNELLILEQGSNESDMDEKTPWLTPIGIMCVDNITADDIKYAKDNNLGIILVNSEKYETVNYEISKSYNRLSNDYYYTYRQKYDLKEAMESLEKSNDLDKLDEIAKSQDEPETYIEVKQETKKENEIIESNSNKDKEIEVDDGSRILSSDLEDTLVSDDGPLIPSSDLEDTLVSDDGPLIPPSDLEDTLVSDDGPIIPPSDLEDTLAPDDGPIKSPSEFDKIQTDIAGLLLLMNDSSENKKESIIFKLNTIQSKIKGNSLSIEEETVLIDTLRRLRNNNNIEYELVDNFSSVIDMLSEDIDKKIISIVDTELNIINSNKLYSKSDNVASIERLRKVLKMDDSESDLRVVEEACRYMAQKISDQQKVVKKLNGIDISLIGKNNTLLSILELRLNKCLKSLPSNLQVLLKNVNIYDTYNPFDAYWKIKYKYNGKLQAAASGGNGLINVYKNGLSFNKHRNMMIIYHELGHVIDRYFASKSFYTGYFTTGYFTEDVVDWKTAMNEDYNKNGKESVTSYGKCSIHEDFAESISLYFTNKKKMARNFPNRTRVIEELISKLSGEDNNLNKESSIDTVANEQFDANKKINLIDKTILSVDMTESILEELYDCNNAQEMNDVLSKKDYDTVCAFINSIDYNKQEFLYNKGVTIVKEIIDENIYSIDLISKIEEKGLDYNSLSFSERVRLYNVHNYIIEHPNTDISLDSVIEDIKNIQLAKTKDAIHSENEIAESPIVSTPTRLINSILSRISNRSNVVKYDIASKFDYTASNGTTYHIEGGSTGRDNQYFTGGAKHMLELINSSCTKTVSREALVDFYDTIKNDSRINHSSINFLNGIIRNSSSVYSLTEEDNRKFLLINNQIKSLNDSRLKNAFDKLEGKMKIILGREKDASGNNTSEYTFINLLKQSGIIDSNNVVQSGILDTANEVTLTNILSRIKNNQDLDFVAVREIASKAVVILYSNVIEEYTNLPERQRKTGWISKVTYKGRNYEIINGQGNNIYHMFMSPSWKTVKTDIKSQLGKMMFDLYNDADLAGVTRTNFKAKLIAKVTSPTTSNGNTNYSYIPDYYLRNKIVNAIEALFSKDSRELSTFVNQVGERNKKQYSRDEIETIIGNLDIAPVVLNVQNIVNSSIITSNANSILTMINDTLIKSFNTMRKAEFKNSILSDSSLTTDKARKEEYKQRLKEKIIHDFVEQNTSLSNSDIKSAILMIENLFDSTNGLDDFINEAYESPNLRIDLDYISSKLNNCKLMINRNISDADLENKLRNVKLIIKQEKLGPVITNALAKPDVINFLTIDLYNASVNVFDGLFAKDDFKLELRKWIQTMINSSPSRQDLENVINHLFSTSEFEEYAKKMQSGLNNGIIPNNDIIDVIKKLYF